MALIAVVFTALGALLTAFVAIVVAALTVVQPWNASTSRQHAYIHEAPYGIFWLTSWIISGAHMLATHLKPPQCRLAEIGAAFTQSQVLYTLVNLGLPDLLAAGGPQTADQIAAVLSATGKPVPASWLDRVLCAAASMGMLKRQCCPASQLQSQQGQSSAVQAQTMLDQGGDVIATVTLHSPNAAAEANVSQTKAKSAASNRFRDALTGSGSSCAYALNAVSAALVSSSPVCMSSFVKLLEDDYAAMTYLSEGLATNAVPFELWSKGQQFWDHLAGSKRHATTFDVAMQQKRHIGGTSIVHGYNFGRFDYIIDVAGGVGGFSADVLAVHPRLQAVVMDQEQQITHGKQIWATYDKSLTCRCELVVGNMFKSDTIPPPPTGSRKVAYVLNDILHNWDDASVLAILKSIRGAVSKSDGKTEVSLLLLETTKAEEVLPCHHHIRCSSDIVMLTLFGDGKERDSSQFRELLAAAGWHMQRLVPTCGIFMVLEATPL